MNTPGRPLANLLFLGPTGSGKTRIVEAAAEILFGNPKAFIKIDCAEFQHSHEIAKIIGSPPGYIGHRETPPMLTQEVINQYQIDRMRFSFILFDEIEKANEALWRLLLGILDKATLTLGDNRKTDLSRCVIFMTSNFGAFEMAKMLEHGIGFTSELGRKSISPELNDKMARVAVDVAKRKFSPEFMNRIDDIVVLRTLSRSDLAEILDIELEVVQNRIYSLQASKVFKFKCSQEAKNFLLLEGLDPKYGARHIKRAIERHLTLPISSLMATGQINLGDHVEVGLAATGNKLAFERKTQMFAAAAASASNSAVTKREFVLQDNTKITVTDQQTELHGLRVGMMVKAIPSVEGHSKDVLGAKTLKVVGILNGKAVIQIDNDKCYFSSASATAGEFLKYYEIVSVSP